MSDTLLDLVQTFLKDFEYKPDTVFYAIPDFHGYSIVAARHLPDSRDPQHPQIHVRAQLEVPESLLTAAYDPRQLLQDMVHSWIRSLEVHEADEWFRVANELPYDPHKEG